MILHSTLPYRQDIPNPALGYLKGFLQGKGVPVQAVYWNLILTRTLVNLHRNLEKHSKESGLSSISGITLFLARHLLTGFNTESTPLSLLFSSVFTRQELSEIIYSLKDEIDQFIRINKIDRASLSGFTLKSHQWPMSLYVMNRLKEMNPDTQVVMGGIVNEGQAQKFMNMIAKADFAIWGEGEYPLYKLVKAIDEGTPFEEVPQLVYRENEKINVTKTLAECPPLDEYPFADHADYFQTLKMGAPPQLTVLIPVWGSRSCPWNKCRFCVLNEGYQYRTRSPENIVKEIEYQSKKHNNDSFIFVDTELPGNRKRFTTLLQLLMESSARRMKPYHFYAEVSPVFMDAETAKAMEHISFTSIQIGFEAMTDPLLKKMQKRHRFAHNIQALKVGNQYNLKISGLNIIRGIPTETEDDVKESSFNVKFLRFLLNKYLISPNVLSLEKSSPFYEEMAESEREDWGENPFWAEIAPTGLMDDRFEFFGFCRDSPLHYHEWDIFERVLMSYQSQNRSYEWIEYDNGSFLEEKGPKTLRYTLDRNETDILIYCDLIKSFKQLKEKFSHIGEDDLRTIVGNLREAGMVYHDEDMHTIISVVEASRRKRVHRS
jgi:radical SAM superfamily enzyme YgiQ (UPF0313 family)